MEDVETLRKWFKYDPETGELRYRIGRPKVRAGDLAGTLTHNGTRRRVRVKGRPYYNTHLIWLLVYGRLPKEGYQIDHINRDPLDDRLCNLREVPPHVNTRNRNYSRKHSGISQNSNGTWTVVLHPKNMKVTVGTYKTLEQALEERDKAEQYLFPR